MNALSIAECHPLTIAPGVSRLFADYLDGAVASGPFYGFKAGFKPGSQPFNTAWHSRPPLPGHWPELVGLLEASNPARSAEIDRMREGAGVVVTGQQVGLFGGPLFTAFKAATAVARARQAAESGRPHVAVFWLATEDHDFAEINHVILPSRHGLERLSYGALPQGPVPVGGVVIDETIGPLMEQAWELVGYSDAMDALAAAYRPGRTFAEAFGEFYGKVFAPQGLLILDARDARFHRMGAPVLAQAIERADELHAALEERNRALAATGYHAQVAVAPGSSLLFLIDPASGARLALRRTPASAAQPGGLWQAGRERFTTGELLAILEAQPERISPAALLRPVFQDYLLSSSLAIGGPAEIAYFAQSSVLYERILGRVSPSQPRLSATLIEPQIATLLHRHELALDRIFSETEDSLTMLLAARAMPVEGKRRLAAAGNALDAELEPLLNWMRALDQGLGRSAETAAGKMRYQMNRLRRLAANHQLQREESLGRQARAVIRALYPQGMLQERLHGAAYYLARYGLELAERLTVQAMVPCTGHVAVWL